MRQVHARIAALEQASAAVGRVEGMLAKDRGTDLGIMHGLDDLRRRLDAMKLEGTGTPASMLGELQEAVGALWKEQQANHREVMAAVSALAARVAASPRELALEALPLALRVVSEVYAQGPKEYGGSDKRARQFDKFAGAVEERCRREAVRARNEVATRSPGARASSPGRG